jgi:hypothetical protein
MMEERFKQIVKTLSRSCDLISPLLYDVNRFLKDYEVAEIESEVKEILFYVGLLSNFLQVITYDIQKKIGR